MEPRRISIDPEELGDMHELAWKEWAESGEAELWENLPWEGVNDGDDDGEIAAS